MKTLTYTVEENTSVYLFLKAHGFSENLIKKLKKYFGQIEVNGVACDVRRRIVQNDIIKLVFEDEELDVPSSNIPIDIVYEDEDILVINKQSGLAVMPTASHYTNSLFSALRYKYGKYFPHHVVTRLDRDTSGLMLICKNSYSHSILNENLHDNIKRKYIAIVHGDIINDGIIQKRIIKSPFGMKRIVSEYGQYAYTEYKVIKNFDKKTLLDIELKTGRTHQIRVHFEYVGHPLCGDKLYGIQDNYSRQALHSCYLSFIHPTLLKPMFFDCLGDDIIDKLLIM